MSIFSDMTGRTFNWLTVKSVARMKPVKWLCECRCGSFVEVGTSKLKNGHTKSCGCYQKHHHPMRTHGASASRSPLRREYGIWCSMRNRCHLPTAHAYRDYGGRGIAVCDRWRGSFEAFITDMGPRPSVKHQLDRIDNNGPYSSENCRWVTAKTNTNNTRNNVKIEWNGATKTASQWADELGVRASLITGRIRNGWTAHDTLTFPAGARSCSYYEANGRRLRLHEWTRETGIKECTILMRLKFGWSVERAVSEPVRNR